MIPSHLVVPRVVQVVDLVDPPEEDSRARRGWTRLKPLVMNSHLAGVTLVVPVGPDRQRNIPEGSKSLPVPHVEGAQLNGHVDLPLPQFDPQRSLVNDSFTITQFITSPQMVLA